MGLTVAKVARDQDLYLVWSSNTESPVFVGERAALLAYLYEREHRSHLPDEERPEARIARADEVGTSSLWQVPGHALDHAFDDTGTIYAQEGFLPRSNYPTFAERFRQAVESRATSLDVRDLLRPFEDGCRCGHAYNDHVSGCSQCRCPMRLA